MKMRIAFAVACAGAIQLWSVGAAVGDSHSAQSRPPYVGEPRVGDAVRLDGTLGGQKTAWAYVDRQWLERYLQMTIDAAAANRAYTDNQVQNRLAAIAQHVSPIPNGTRASVENVQEFDYSGRADVEVRVMVIDGPMRGRELWTTCAELVDPAGHPYLQL